VLIINGRVTIFLDIMTKGSSNILLMKYENEVVTQYITIKLQTGLPKWKCGIKYQ
jgi:hypothetical protein